MCRFPVITVIALVWLLLGAVPSSAADLDGWRLMQLSAKEQLAVFRAPDGQLQLSKVGDRLGEKLTVTGFDGEQVVLEKAGEWGRVTLFVSLADGRQQIDSRERQPLRKLEFSGEPTERMSAPQVSVPKGL